MGVTGEYEVAMESIGEIIVKEELARILESFGCSPPKERISGTKFLRDHQNQIHMTSLKRMRREEKNQSLMTSHSSDSAQSSRDDEETPEQPPAEMEPQEEMEPAEMEPAEMESPEMEPLKMEADEMEAADVPDTEHISQLIGDHQERNNKDEQVGMLDAVHTLMMKLAERERDAWETEMIDLPHENPSSSLSHRGVTYHQKPELIRYDLTCDHHRSHQHQMGQLLRDYDINLGQICDLRASVNRAAQDDDKWRILFQEILDKQDCGLYHWHQNFSEGESQAGVLRLCLPGKEDRPSEEPHSVPKNYAFWDPDQVWPTLSPPAEVERESKLYNAQLSGMPIDREQLQNWFLPTHLPCKELALDNGNSRVETEIPWPSE